jgi:hypothetical protein
MGLGQVFRNRSRRRKLDIIMGDPYIERKTTPSKLDAAPSIQRNTTPSKLGAEPSVQRESTGSRGTPLKTDGAPTQRQVAKDMGIDTKGLSTREVKEAVSEKKDAQQELANFIKETIKDLPKNSLPAAAGGGSPTVTSRKTEDRPSRLPQSQHKDSPKTELGTDFYCYYNGKRGTISLLNRGFSEL